MQPAVDKTDRSPVKMGPTILISYHAIEEGTEDRLAEFWDVFRNHNVG